MKRVVVFASGTKDGGGSGFQALVEKMRMGVLRADIVSVVSQHERGGVRKHAKNFDIPFHYFHGAKDAGAEDYRRIVEEAKADFVFLSGWMHRTQGLDPRTTINIHPGPLPEFGGKGMYGRRVHTAVMKAFRSGKLTVSAVSMHFVTDEYDCGPVFFQCPVGILARDTPESLKKRVNDAEHVWQAYVSDFVVQGKIHWDGKNPKSLVVPPDYPFHRPVKLFQAS